MQNDKTVTYDFTIPLIPFFGLVRFVLEIADAVLVVCYIAFKVIVRHVCVV